MSARARILLVEDSPTQSLQLSEKLGEQGWDVVVQTSAEMALRELNTTGPDLILVDYNLPNMAGDEFCRQVRMRIDTRIIPIIMLTSETSFDLETRGLESGADDFVRKSANAEHLVLRIRTMLRRVGNRSSVLQALTFESSRSRVLAIDDSATYLAFLESRLGGELYGLETTESTGVGLRRVETGDIDCVLVDFVMPELDGIAVCKQIDGWRRRCGARTMILMLTGKEDTQGLERALEAGADDFVGKSSDIVVIKVRIRALLRRKFYEDENHRILEELKRREFEAERARMAQEAAEARSRLFEQLQKTAADLLRSNAELEEFAYAASHDLRAPLHAIGNLAEWLREDLRDRLSKEEDAKLGIIRGRVGRLQTLVDDLLQYSRAGHAVEAPEPVETGAMVREVIDLLGPPEGFTVTVAASMPVIVTAKPPLRQVLSNLIGNAIKHHDRTNGRVEISAGDLASHVRFRIQDDGPGIAAQYHERIFGLFQTLNSRDRKEGSGLGLAFVRRVVELHGGAVTVESQEGQGAAFVFTWPKQPIDTSPVESSRKVAALLGGPVSHSGPNEGERT